MFYKIYRKGCRSVEIQSKESAIEVGFYIASIKVNVHYVNHISENERFAIFSFLYK